MNAKQRYYEKNKDLFKQRTREHRQRKQHNKSQSQPMEDRTTENIIIQYYKCINQHYDFTIWIRNMRRINKEFLQMVETPTDEFIVGKRYISLIPNAINELGTPIFFRIKGKDDETLNIEIVNCVLLKVGTGESIYKPLWNEKLRNDIITDNLNNIIEFNEDEIYYGKNEYFIEKVNFYDVYVMRRILNDK